MKALRLFWQLVRIRIKISLIYRANFLISIVAMTLWIGIYVAFFEVLFLHVDTISGWNKGEMLVFLAFYYFVLGIGNILYRESFEQFGEKMRRGLIDQTLTKPAPKQLILFFESIRFDHVVDFALTFVLFGYIAFFTPITFNLALLGSGLLLAIFGNLMFYGILLSISSILFYVDRMDGIGSLVWHVTQVSRYPRQIYTGAGKILFQILFPIALITSIPAEVSLNSGSIKLVLYFMAISVLFFLIGNGLFAIGLRKYSSAA